MGFGDLFGVLVSGALVMGAVKIMSDVSGKVTTPFKY